jgi:hypothetical protein
MPIAFNVLLLLIALVPTFFTAREIWSSFPDSILTANHATVLQDYIVMWVSGRLALTGQTSLLATSKSFGSAITALLGPGIDTAQWFYPPHMLLLSAPLSLLPPFSSMVVWLVLTGGLLWLVMRATGFPLAVRLATMLSPAFWENAFDGHNGALLTACVIGSLTWARRRPVLAGLCLSVLTLKPQMALIVPVCLLAARLWRTLGWATVFTLGWIVTTLAWFGVTPWLDYLEFVIPQARDHLTIDQVPFGFLYYQNLVVTVFAAARGFGAGVITAQMAQACATVVAVGLGARAWWSRDMMRAAWQLPFALTLIPLATPYAMTYDMIGPSLAAACLMAQPAPSRIAICAAALAWAWPGLSFYAGAMFMPGLGALVYAVLAAAVWQAGQFRWAELAPA